MRSVLLKEQVVLLRKEGKTYSEIQQLIGTKIPKSTLSDWCSSIHFTVFQLNRIEERIKRGGEAGRAVALAGKRKRRNEYFETLFRDNSQLRSRMLEDIQVAKMILATLYFTEGSKHQNGTLMFGNSNPRIIKLFMQLFRLVYKIDNSKFRCTVQCRADQNIPKLEKAWSDITKIPLSQFYKARIDPRTVGKISTKKEYKGVCRIDYFSADVYNDILVTGKVILGEKFGPMV